jgi:hypothetical protein
VHIVEAGLMFSSESLKLYLNDYVPESIGSNYTLDIVNITGRSISICCVLLSITGLEHGVQDLLLPVPLVTRAILILNWVSSAPQTRRVYI